jgi:hypothetical protein
MEMTDAELAEFRSRLDLLGAVAEQLGFYIVVETTGKCSAVDINGQYIIHDDGSMTHYIANGNINPEEPRDNNHSISSSSDGDIE